LHNVKPEYSVTSLEAKRAKEKKVLNLRKTDYTTGHILSSSSSSVNSKSSILHRNLLTSSFSSAAVLSLTTPILSQTINHKNKLLSADDVPPIYVDPEVIKYLPKTSDGVSKKQKAKGRKKSPDSNMRRSPSQMIRSKTSSPTNPAKLPNNDDMTVNSSASISQQTIYTGIKSFSVFGIDKSTTSDLVVEILTREPWDDCFTVRVISTKEGLLASKTIELKKARKLESYYSTNNHEGSQDIFELHELLTSLFIEADINKAGSLKYEEFIACMQKADLGISAPELRLVMAEADDNDDGVIDYEEFVPIAIDLIQAFKARASARRAQLDQAQQIDEEAIKLLYTSELDHTVHFLTGLLIDVDTRSSGTVSRQEFKIALNNPGTCLSKVEAKMIENDAPRDKFNRIVYRSIADTVQKVRLATIKNAIAETMATDIEKYIMDLCKEQERDDTSDPAVAELPDSEFPYSGSLTDRKIANLLQNANMLSMNRLQVLAIMCEAEVVDGIVDYWKFVPIAAKAIENMFEPGAMQQRAMILEQSEANDESLMHGKQREEIEDMIKIQFRQADVNKDGWLDPNEFAKVLEGMDLGLKRSEINALMTTGDLDGNGFIDLNEFLQLAYDQLLYLEREKHIRELQSTVMSETTQMTASASAGASAQGKRSRTASTDQREQDEKADETAVALLEEMLINLFLKADWNGTGYLTAVEFREILDSLDLGITSFQQTILMAEADENEDGKIQYGEFVPVCAELLQAFKAKAAAEKEHKDAELQIDTNVKLFLASSKNQLKLKINSVLDQLHASDPLKTGKIDRPALIKLLRNNVNLEKSEANMIIHSLTSESDGSTAYGGVEEIMHHVFEVNSKRKFQSELPHSSLESHLVQLLEDEEKKLRAEEEAALKERIVAARAEGDDDTVMSEMSEHPSADQAHHEAESRMKKMANMGQQGLVALDFDDDVDEMTVFTLTAGFLPANRIFGALKSAKHLRLSRVQLLAVMSLAHVDESSIEEVPYRDFASTAAEMITKFFDPRESKRRALLEKRTDMNPLKLLNGMSRRDMEKRLREQLEKVDSKKRGNVGDEIFKQIVSNVMEQCNLTKSEFTSIIAMAQRNSANRIIWKSFVDAAYDSVLHLKRERILHGDLNDTTSMASNETAHSSEARTLLVPPSSKEQEKLTEAMFALVNLEARRGELVLAFEEASKGAAISEEDTEKMKVHRVSTKAKDIVSKHPMSSPSSHMLKIDAGYALLAKMQRACAVIDEDGNNMNTKGEVFIAGMKGSVQDFMEMYVVVNKNTNEETDDELIEIRGFEGGEGGRVLLEKILKMPSIACADLDAATMLAGNIASSVKVVVNGQGERRFKF
jgi:Ca2+-binding EF-hand superfamily protein